jgi:hypothetical protein
MGRSKLSLALSLLMLFILACTCGNRGKNSNSNKIDISVENNDNSSNSNKRTNSNDNRTPPTTTSNSTGIAECDAYMKLIEDYLNCNDVPDAVREPWKKQRDNMIQQIKDAAKTEAQKETMAENCKKLTEDYKNVLKCN